jgi:hypothetical protein
MTRSSILVVVALAAGCGGIASSGGTSSGTGGQASSAPGEDDAAAADAAACVYPAGADTFVAASSSGCTPSAAHQICQVSNGATILPDGAVSGGTETCKSLCPAAQYELTCQGAADPAASLACNVIPIPTPSDILFYCCPCGG